MSCCNLPGFCLDGFWADTSLQFISVNLQIYCTHWKLTRLCLSVLDIGAFVKDIHTLANTTIFWVEPTFSSHHFIMLVKSAFSIDDNCIFLLQIWLLVWFSLWRTTSSSYWLGAFPKNLVIKKGSKLGPVRSPNFAGEISFWSQKIPRKLHFWLVSFQCLTCELTISMPFLDIFGRASMKPSTRGIFGPFFRCFFPRKTSIFDGDFYSPSWHGELRSIFQAGRLRQCQANCQPHYATSATSTAPWLSFHLKPSQK